jgi:hypothetical protein
MSVYLTVFRAVVVTQSIQPLTIVPNILATAQAAGTPLLFDGVLVRCNEVFLWVSLIHGTRLWRSSMKMFVARYFGIVSLYPVSLILARAIAVSGDSRVDNSAWSVFRSTVVNDGWKGLWFGFAAFLLSSVLEDASSLCDHSRFSRYVFCP